MRRQKTKYIPTLDPYDPRDTGARYMVARHRFLIAEKFNHDRRFFKAEYPDKESQNLAMLAFKTEDPEKYNKWFGIYVRGEEPETEIIQTKVTIPDELLEDVNKFIMNKLSILQQSIDNEYEEASGKLGEISQTIIQQSKNWEKHFSDYITNKIDEESKKFNKVEFVVKKQSGKEIKIEDPVPEQFRTIIDLVSQRMNILLVGPSGCGKTKLTYMVADALEMDFAAQSCSAGMSESSFAGWLLPIEEHGRFVYVQSEFVRLYENGGIFLFDEIDAADSNTLLFLNQALANDRFYLPQRHENPMIKRHPDFVAIAAANTHGNGATALYSGRNILDGATMDRFRMGIVAMDYSDVVEEKLIDPMVLVWGREVRRIINTKHIRKIMSTRLLLDATKMKNNAGWSFTQISVSYFSDWSKEELKMLVDDRKYKNDYLISTDGLNSEQAKNLSNKQIGELIKEKVRF